MRVSDSPKLISKLIILIIFGSSEGGPILYATDLGSIILLLRDQDLPNSHENQYKMAVRRSVDQRQREKGGGRMGERGSPESISLARGD